MSAELHNLLQIHTLLKGLVNSIISIPEYTMNCEYDNKFIIFLNNNQIKEEEKINIVKKLNKYYFDITNGSLVFTIDNLKIIAAEMDKLKSADKFSEYREKYNELKKLKDENGEELKNIEIKYNRYKYEISKLNNELRAHSSKSGEYINELYKQNNLLLNSVLNSQNYENIKSYIIALKKEIKEIDDKKSIINDKLIEEHNNEKQICDLKSKHYNIESDLNSKINNIENIIIEMAMSD